MNKITILDAAMGSELEQRGVPMHKEIWAGLAALEHSDVIQSIHEDNKTTNISSEQKVSTEETSVLDDDHLVVDLGGEIFPVPFREVERSRLATDWSAQGVAAKKDR